MVAELNFIKLNKLSYLIYREPIIELYFQAFTSGEYSQVLERSYVEKIIDELINVGRGILVLSDERLVGFLLASPLSAHTDFPNNQLKAFSVDETI